MVYSQRLVGPVTPAAGITAVATVPALKTWLVKYVSIRNGGAGATVPLLSTTTALSGTVWQGASVAAGEATREHVWLVFEAGQTIHLNTAGSSVLALHGYELDNS